MKSGNPPIRPEIFEHLDYHQYMDRFYAHKKNTEPQFSYQGWAAKAGFKSGSFLRLIVAGRRSVTPSGLPHFVHALELKSHKATYFAKLVDYNSATTLELRNYQFQQLLRINKFKSFQRIKDAYRFLSNFESPKLLLLLGLEGGPRIAEKISKFLGFSSSETNLLLEDLSQQGFVERVDSSIWQDKLNQLLDQLVYKYHQQPTPVSETKVKIYQLNYNYIPVSEALIQEKTKKSCAPESNYQAG